MEFDKIQKHNEELKKNIDTKNFELEEIMSKNNLQIKENTELTITINKLTTEKDELAKDRDNNIYVKKRNISLENKLESKT